MKKLFYSLIAIVLAFSFTLSACGGSGKPDNDSDEYSLNVRTSEVQNIKIGDVPSKILYNVKPKDSEVTFVSSDDGIVAVDKYGEVTGVSEGTATVTVALKKKPKIKKVITYNVSRNFFKHNKGYANGNADFSKEDNGEVAINGEQTQILADKAGQNWYFRTTLSYTDAATEPGSFGIGSFMVDIAHPIGDTMFWYMVWPTSGQLCTGGWRYALGLNYDHKDIDGAKVDTSKPFDLTMIRYGTEHYLIAEQDGVVINKTVFDVPYFSGTDTYPGIYGQNLYFKATDFTATNDVAEVTDKLAEFTLPTAIEISAPGTKLFAGETYNLKAVVSPVEVFDKSGRFSLATPVEGVTLTEDGVLTIADTANGSITINVKASADETVTGSKTFTIEKKAASQSAIVDTGAVVGNATVNNNTVTVSGETYVPLMVNGENWYLTAKVNTVGSAAGKKAGLMSALNGFTDYTRFSINYVGSGNDHKADISTVQSTVITAFGAETDPMKEGEVHELGLLKQGYTLYIFADGKLMKSVNDVEDSTIPALYADTAAVFKDITVTTDKAEIEQVLADNPFFVGGYVTMTTDSYGNRSYKFASNRWQGNKNNIDWPPVNNFENGISYRTALTGDYTIEYTVSDIDFTKGVNNDGKGIDAKFLVYLRSESPSSSLQFTFERLSGEKGDPEARFVPCLKDDTWTGYDYPEGYKYADIWKSGSVNVKIVKNHDRIELYLNGTRIFENEMFMENQGEWGTKTVCTPGIGTFACGATVSNVKITLNNQA